MSKSKQQQGNNNMDLEQKYKKYDSREHVLHRPGMYIGSTEKDKYNTWVLAQQEEGVTAFKFEKRLIESVPGLYKIFDEILVNAIDHITRLKMIASTTPEKAEDMCHVKNVKITIDKVSGLFSVFNDGDGIEVEKHPEHGCYIPELIFGNMLTSTNYDDNEEKIIGGQNGIGAKACNIFSKSFTIETVDHRRKKLYTQEFSENMSVKSVPVIKACSKKPYTMITFKPDYERFGLGTNFQLSDDMYSLFARRCFDVCALTDSDVTVWFNGKKLETKNFEKYTDLYLGDKNAHFRVYEKINERWEIVVAPSLEPGQEQVSFVNGIWTVNGGKHVDYIANQVATKLAEMITKKRKDVHDVKPQHIKNNMMVFVKCTVVNPAFDSQSKETLTTPASKFGGGKIEVSDKLIEKLYKSELTERVLSMSDASAAKSLKKTDGKKTSRVIVPKLNDANWAGTKNSGECTLILTEGLSAATMAIAGLSVVGRDKYGVFPLRGKILNVKDAVLKKIQENEEITNLKKIIGLEHNKEYKDASELRYGRVMVMCDSDVDGSHIKGLLFNVFQSLWPSLYKLDGFITTMLTPIVKVSSARGGVIQFYSLTDYENWVKVLEASPEGLRGWKIKYYKGLGTSTEAEAKEYFKDMKRVTYKYEGATSDEALDLAFNKKRADDRKDWLMKYDRERILNYNDTSVAFGEFVHKELIHFSNRDLERSINNLCDGLKESTRKIMFGCFKRKLFRDEVKVAQLAAYVAEVSAYHHGEASLQQAITGMAQIFVGTNNVNLLAPNGQFGTRISGGGDAASPRYIYTLLSKLAKTVYREEDVPILKNLDDDGVSVEPEYYIPIVPMILINGGLGIGTGFSTNIPCHNPMDVIVACRKIASALATEVGTIDSDVELKRAEDVIKSIELDDMKPWYLGFTGEIVKHKEGTYMSKGVYKWINDTTVEVTELPIGTWTDDYKDMLNDMLASPTNKYLKDYESHYTAKKVRFILKLQAGAQRDLAETFESDFKLTSTKNLSLNNIHLFSAAGAIQKYKDTTAVVKDWAVVRVRKYVERKQYQVRALQRDLKYLQAKVRFIQEIIDAKLVLNNKRLVDVEAELRKAAYPVCDVAVSVPVAGANADDDGGGSYAYLTRMPLHHLTTEKKAALEKEAAMVASTLKALKSKTIQSIWLEELGEFADAWATHKKMIEDEYAADTDDAAGSGKAVPKKRAAAPKKMAA